MLSSSVIALQAGRAHLELSPPPASIFDVGAGSSGAAGQGHVPIAPPPSADAHIGDPFLHAAVAHDISKASLSGMGQYDSSKIGNVTHPPDAVPASTSMLMPAQHMQPTPGYMGSYAAAGSSGGGAVSGASRQAYLPKQVVLGGAGPGTAPCAGYAALQLDGNVLPGSATAAHGDPLLQAVGLHSQRHTDAQPPSPGPYRNRGGRAGIPYPGTVGDVSASYEGLNQHYYVAAPSVNAHHGDPLMQAVMAMGGAQATLPRTAVTPTDAGGTPGTGTGGGRGAGARGKGGVGSSAGASGGSPSSTMNIFAPDFDGRVTSAAPEAIQKQSWTSETKQQQAKQQQQKKLLSKGVGDACAGVGGEGIVDADLLSGQQLGSSASGLGGLGVSTLAPPPLGATHAGTAAADTSSGYTTDESSIAEVMPRAPRLSRQLTDPVASASESPTGPMLRSSITGVGAAPGATASSAGYDATSGAATRGAYGIGIGGERVTTASSSKQSSSQSSSSHLSTGIGSAPGDSAGSSHGPTASDLLMTPVTVDKDGSNVASVLHQRGVGLHSGQSGGGGGEGIGSVAGWGSTGTGAGPLCGEGTGYGTFYDVHTPSTDLKCTSNGSAAIGGFSASGSGATGHRSDVSAGAAGAYDADVDTSPSPSSGLGAAHRQQHHGHGQHPHREGMVMGGGTGSSGRKHRSRPGMGAAAPGFPQRAAAGADAAGVLPDPPLPQRQSQVLGQPLSASSPPVDAAEEIEGAHTPVVSPGASSSEEDLAREELLEVRRSRGMSIPSSGAGGDQAAGQPSSSGGQFGGTEGYDFFGLNQFQESAALSKEALLQQPPASGGSGSGFVRQSSSRSGSDAIGRSKSSTIGRPADRPTTVDTQGRGHPVSVTKLTKADPLGQQLASQVQNVLRKASDADQGL